MTDDIKVNTSGLLHFDFENYSINSRDVQKNKEKEKETPIMPSQRIIDAFALEKDFSHCYTIIALLWQPVKLQS